MSYYYPSNYGYSNGYVAPDYSHTWSNRGYSNWGRMADIPVSDYERANEQMYPNIDDLLPEDERSRNDFAAQMFSPESDASELGMTRTDDLHIYQDPVEKILITPKSDLAGRDEFESGIDISPSPTRSQTIQYRPLLNPKFFKRLLIRQPRPFMISYSDNKRFLPPNVIEPPFRLGNQMRIRDTLLNRPHEGNKIEAEMGLLEEKKEVNEEKNMKSVEKEGSMAAELSLSKHES
ncbi:unnamed protein product [Protopolystoma xenopodis]|uniref:Uncharacterized protein n=1 Tax=Protopolystoma xenopodis TaxID=117903 RepID=A0A448WDA4_9PLAT|nr:unnamed protein product [Protopolystoma xenopodis]